LKSNAGAFDRQGNLNIEFDLNIYGILLKLGDLSVFVVNPLGDYPGATALPYAPGA
jgi:hypothetical protein